jgi:hypothetical protein
LPAPPDSLDAPEDSDDEAVDVVVSVACPVVLGTPDELDDVDEPVAEPVPIEVSDMVDVGLPPPLSPGAA